MACMVVTTTRVMPNWLERRQRHGQHHGRAVGIGDDLPFPAAGAAAAGPASGGRDSLPAPAAAHRVPCGDSGSWTPPRARPSANALLDFGGHRRVHGREKRDCGALPGFEFLHDEFANVGGHLAVEPPLVASAYFFPAERSLAPSPSQIEPGWSWRNFTKCWPTIPVAPRIPTSMRGCVISSLRALCRGPYKA